MNELVGAAEIAEKLGLAKSTVVHDWRRRYPEFPEPVAELTAGMVWAWPDVERWANESGRRPIEDKRISRSTDRTWVFFCPSHKPGEPTVAEFASRELAEQFAVSHDQALHGAKSISEILADADELAVDVDMKGLLSTGEQRRSHPEHEA